MKKQIKRLSPHQNGKVFGIVMAIIILPIFLPMTLIMSFTMPQVDQQGHPMHFPMIIFWLMPIFYFIFGYISVVMGCVIYNFIFKYIGGFEFETSE